MKSKAVLSQTEVSAILAAARTEAQANGWNVTIVVADDDGHVPAVGLRFGTGGGKDGGDFGLTQYGFAFHVCSS